MWRGGSEGRRYHLGSRKRGAESHDVGEQSRGGITRPVTVSVLYCSFVGLGNRTLRDYQEERDGWGNIWVRICRGCRERLNLRLLLRCLAAGIVLESGCWATRGDRDPFTVMSKLRRRDRAPVQIPSPYWNRVPSTLPMRHIFVELWLQLELLGVCMQGCACE